MRWVLWVNQDTMRRQHFRLYWRLDWRFLHETGECNGKVDKKRWRWKGRMKWVQRLNWIWLKRIGKMTLERMDETDSDIELDLPEGNWKDDIGKDRWDGSGYWIGPDCGELKRWHWKGWMRWVQILNWTWLKWIGKMTLERMNEMGPDI